MKYTSHLFIVDPIKDLNLALDTSVRIAKSLCHKGHTSYLATIESLSLSSQVGPFATAQKMCADPEADSGFVLEPASELVLSEVSAVHMRKDPPTDEKYWSATWILSRLPSSVRTYNDPEALRSINEKLSILDFMDTGAVDPVLVTSCPKEIQRFGQESCHNDIIIKPLTLYGGRGVERIEFSKFSDGQLAEKLAESTDHGSSMRIVQPFNQAIFEGEIRVFCAGSEPISWCLKKPKEGEFLANTARGATLEDFKPSERIDKTVRKICAVLQERGVFFTGFDIIGDKVSEINITSPRLLAKDLNQSYFDKIADLIILDLEP